MAPEAPKPFAKLYTVFSVTARLIIPVILFTDIIFKLRSLYWEVGKMVALLIVMMGMLILERITNKWSWLRIIGLAVISAALYGLYGWDAVNQYKHNVILDKLGKEFNPQRRELGLPVIPAGWYIKDRDKHSTEWQGNDTIGHYWKMTWVDSSYLLETEYDVYRLKSGGDVEIDARFSKGNKLDSISYSHEEGSDSRTITRRQADSIFAAEKIQKDY
jgi:hypothetical protein